MNEVVLMGVVIGKGVLNREGRKDGGWRRESKDCLGFCFFSFFFESFLLCRVYVCVCVLLSMDRLTIDD